MSAYFDFLRYNGERLEPKTRALISIITKVVNQTESGLKQYAQKAVSDGVSGDEILDGIMMAFPALGLSKTLWAVDVLLECGVLSVDDTDDFQRGKWHDTGAALEAGGIQILECEGRHLFAVGQRDDWRVFDTRCPHQGTDLAFCDVHGATVECPLHGWRFDLTSGKCTRFGTQDLDELEARVEGTRLLALW